MKRATYGSTLLLFITNDFNPRPREEGDDSQEIGLIMQNLISIHALVKRATLNVCFKIINIQISIHALVKRAT